MESKTYSINSRFNLTNSINRIRDSIKAYGIFELNVLSTFWVSRTPISDDLEMNICVVGWHNWNEVNGQATVYEIGEDWNKGVYAKIDEGERKRIRVMTPVQQLYKS